MTRAAQTAIKMLESLSEPAQERVTYKLRELVEEERGDEKWDGMFRKKKKLTDLARRAKEEIRKGKASDMEYDKL